MAGEHRVRKGAWVCGTGRGWEVYMVAQCVWGWGEGVWGCRQCCVY